ncbi:MAG: HD-GYP domain-containing protein [Capsulimonadaceae bacterium]|nr:HD-GYP domain-containing protein [Capsulimonadaceae bacterium]
MTGHDERNPSLLARPFLLPDLDGKRYSLYVAIAGLPVIAASLAIAANHPIAWMPFWLFALVAVAISFFPVPVSCGDVFLSPILPVAAAMVYRGGPLLAIIVAALAVAAQVVFIRRARLLTDPIGVLWDLMYNIAPQVIAIGAAGTVYWTLLDCGAFRRESLTSAIVLSVLAFAAFYVNAFFMTTIASKEHGIRWDIVWFENYRWTLRGALLMAPLGFFAGALSVQHLGYGAAMIAMPMIAAQRGFTLHVRKRGIYRQGVDLLGRLMQEAHPYTHGHLHRVAEWSSKIGSRMGLSAQSMTMIEDAAILHDIGKVAIDDRILNKPGRLNDHDWRIIKEHPVIGAEIVGKMRYFERAAYWIRHHHERFDGMGYPSSLLRDRIPIESRIIAVVDAYDAMVGGPSIEANRTYRPPKSQKAACDELRRCAGSQFDPEIVRVFIEVLDDEEMLSSRFAGEQRSRALSSI